jgi:hypothetical protein
MHATRVFVPGAVCCLSLLLTTLSARGAPPSSLDTAVEANCRAAGVPLADPCDDATFLRRAWLDLAGRVPPVIPARQFLDAADASKRERLVAELLESEDFTTHWGRVLTEVFTDRRPIRHAMHDGTVLSRHLRDALATGTSYRDIVRELIEGRGVSDASGPANFLLRYEVQPDQLAGAVANRFLGVSLQCAQCHDHPFQKWRQDDFWGVAAFFGRTQRLDGNTPGGDYLRAVVDVQRGELRIPDSAADPDPYGNRPQKLVRPLLPEGSEPTIAGSRRAALAEWITSSDNPYFARNAVNRIWAQLFGRGLVEPLDGLGAESPGPHADVLEALAQDFAQSGFDFRGLLRSIVLSRTYARQAAPHSTDGKVDDAAATRQQLEHLACHPVHPLSVDQLYFSIVQATGYTGVDEDGERRAIAEDPNAVDALAYADRPAELVSSRALSVQRSLVLLNSEYVQEAVKQGARAAVAGNGQRPGAAHIDHLFIATLSRRPTPDEQTAMLTLLRQADWQQHGLEDVLWVLLNSAEFNLTH